MLSVLLLFSLLPVGFRNRELRGHVAPLPGLPPERYASSQATCDLRRLRLRGLIKRVPGTHHYHLTDAGRRVALCYCRVHRRALNPMLAATFETSMPPKLGRIVQVSPRGRSRMRLVAVGLVRTCAQRLRDEGHLVRTACELYQAADAGISARHGLVEVSRRLPHGVVCLLSALQFDGLAKRAAHKIWTMICSKK